MPGSQERVNPDTQLLHRYLDGDLSPAEAERFRARLAESPELSQRLHELEQLGSLVRGWAASAEERAGDLVAPTLERVHEAQRRSSRNATLGYALVAALVVALPWSRRPPELANLTGALHVAPPSSAAIERVQATDQQAQVFVVGRASTPVVWLADDAQEDDATPDQDPG